MSEQENGRKPLPPQAWKRMPYYLHFLKRLREEGQEIVSAPLVAENLDLNEIQVRKDFAAVSTSGGKPKSGFSVPELIDNMEHILGYDNVNDAVLVGAGSLGRALLSYKGFDSYGMRIVCAFDEDEGLVGTTIAGKKVLSAQKISSMCRRLHVHIGIITVPAEQAQVVCDQLVAGGVLAIWNYAPVYLSTPKDILVQNENAAASLALLSRHLQEKLNR